MRADFVGIVDAAAQIEDSLYVFANSHSLETLLELRCMSFPVKCLDLTTGKAN